MLDQFKKAVALTQKTGDKLIVFDSQNPHLAYAVMPLAEYEKIAIKREEIKNLTEDELLDRINRDIAIWKSEQINKENKSSEDIDFAEETDEFTVSDYVDAPTENRPVNDFFVSDESDYGDNIKAKKSKNSWNIPADRKKGAEEIIEEDRQYLEEITF